MILKEVVINGFKSFADRTSVKLDPGVTCIVGPNGCGKSNIVDAIRWVLGEQSAKALRGSKMHDVIFQGTDKRKALPSCEVSLRFTDCEAELGTNFNEVEISRRVDREGGGDYFINGKRCRLKDIQRLFMDTGVGRASYSFMMQGQIDQILSSNPQERRTIFEEAAGITRYKAQRKEALGKLALVDQNLSRVTDVIDEVSRQIGSLKRQASKALRYQRFKHRLTHLDLAYNGYFYAKRAAAIEELERKSEGLRTIAASDIEKLRDEEASLEARRSERAQTAQRLQETQQHVFELRSEKENAQSQSEFATIRRQDIAERLVRLQEEVEGMERQIDEIATQAQNAAESKAEAQEVVDSSDEVFRSRNQAFEGIIRGMAEQEAALDEARQDTLIREGGLTRLRQQATSMEVELQTFQVKHAGLADTLHELRDQRDVLSARAEQVQYAVESREAAAAEAASGVEAAREHTQSLRARFKQLQQEISECDRQVARQTAQLQTLESLQSRFEGFSAGAKAILQGQFGDVIAPNEFCPLSAVLSPQEAYVAALETLLGGAGEAIHISRSERVLPLLRALEEKRSGRAVVQLGAGGIGVGDIAAGTTGFGSAGGDGGAGVGFGNAGGTLAAGAGAGSAARGQHYDNSGIALPEWLVPAASVVRAQKPEFATLVGEFFDGCFFVPDLDTFLPFWQANPGLRFALVATQNNELVDARGLIYGGYTKKGQQDSSFLQRDGQIRKLREQVAVDNERLTVLNEQAMQLQSDMDEAERMVEERRMQQQSVAEELSSLASDARATRQSLDANAVQVSRHEMLLGELEQSREQATLRLESARSAMEGAEQSIAEGRARVTEIETAIKRLQNERDAHKDGLAEVRLDLAEKRQRLEMLERGLRDADSQRRDLQERILRRRQEIDTLSEQSQQLEGAIGHNAARAEELERTLEETMGVLERLRQELASLEQRIAQAEGHLNEVRAEQGSRQGALSQCEVKLAEERSQSNFLIEKVRSDYELEIGDINWRQELWEADEPFETKIKLDELEEDDGGSVSLRPRAKHERGEPTEEDIAAMDETNWPEVEEEIRTLRGRIHSLGAVNLVAIEEYAELRDRFQFLKTQSDDLWRSKEELMKAIDEINATSQQMFKETFDQIRKNFIFTFEKLFAGGSADLALVEAEDVLDSGIEITARPPGTKLRSLSLLSGGQRTMTAVALLFAIYMVKPSPFAVLDELDAPLDDANIGRFTDMVLQFVKHSQFLIITHNKRTVSAANSIYGVTMQERGVTKLISMRFNSNKDSIETESDGDTVTLEPAGIGG